MDGGPGDLAIMAALGAAVFVALVVVMILAMTRWSTTPDRGTALIVTDSRGSRVSFVRTLVLPIVHRAETIDLSMHTIVIQRRGREGIGCRDNIRADVRAVFVVRVNRTQDDVLKVAEAVGCARAGDPAALLELFGDKFIEALRTVAGQFDFDRLVALRADFKDSVIEVVGRDLNGFILDDLAVESIEQTPLEMLDPNNVLDAQGILKITETTCREQVRVNELKKATLIELAEQDLRANEGRRQLF